MGLKPTANHQDNRALGKGKHQLTSRHSVHAWKTTKEMPPCSPLHQGDTHLSRTLCFPSCQRPDKKKVNPQKNECVIYAKEQRSRRYRGFVMKSSLCPGVSGNRQGENRSSVTHPPLLCAVSCQHRKLLGHWNAVSPQYPNCQPTGRFAGHSHPHGM